MKSPKLYASALRRYKRSKGFGIHSPFAFHFVRATLGERLPYYAYERIETSRALALRLAHGVARHPRIMSSKNARMIFRVACRFNPPLIYQIGSHFGVSAMSVLAVSGTSRLTLYAPANSHDAIFSEVTAPLAQRISRADVFAPSYATFIQEATRPFVVVSSVPASDAGEIAAALCDTLASSEAVVVVRNLTRPAEGTARLWKELTSSLAAGMSFTNGNIGFIVSRHDLPVQHFTLWF